MGGRDLRLVIVAVVLGVALGVVGFIGIRSFSPEEGGTASPAPQQQAQDGQGAGASSGQGAAATTQSVRDIVAGMTLEEKVAQLFIVYPEQITHVSVQTLAGDATRTAISDYPVGGIVLFAQNLEDPDQTRSMLANMQSYSQEVVGVPLFLCVDEEGGSVVRIADNPAFGIEDVGDMADVGATANAGNGQAVGVAIGSYLSDLGFTVDFAPVADVATAQGGVMGRRSFGSDASLVADFVGAEVEGMLTTDVLPCAKHFPGIGGVVGDSETGVITSTRTLAEMRQEELLPFQSAVKAGVPMVMVGHLTCAGIDESGLPASLDPEVVAILRNDLGFKGVIVTDSLSMGAVTGLYDSSQIGVQALLAGDDMILMPQDFEACYQGILDAVADGTLSEERIDESVTRIVEAKQAL